MDNIEVVIKRVDGIGPWICTKEDMLATWGIIVAEWEGGLRDNILNICTKRGTVIQAGGHQGFYARLLSEHFHHVFTFEPLAMNYYCLYQNCYQKGNITMFPAALGSKADMMTNLYMNHNLGMNRVISEKELRNFIKKENVTTVQEENIPQLLLVTQVTLDSFPFKDVDLIYLDIEGAELNVLKGAKRIIKQYSPIIVLEKPNDKTMKYMDNLGYKLETTCFMDHFFVKNME